jgi:hypothetical protein
MMLTRDQFNKLWGVIGALCAAISLGLGLKLINWTVDKQLILALWVAIPPLFFFCDWIKYGPEPKEENAALIESISHTHDLARNIWLALIVILTVLYEIPFPGAGD